MTDSVELSPLMAEKLEELRNARGAIRAWKLTADALTAELKAYLRGADGTVGGALVIVQTERAGSRRVDYARLATEFPDAYQACVSTTKPSLTFTVH
jgi:hypothetical protein